MNRRSFIKSTATATSVFTLPKFSIAEPGKTKKINVAVVGVGGMGGYALGEAAKENLVATVSYTHLTLPTNREV